MSAPGAAAGSGGPTTTANGGVWDEAKRQLDYHSRLLARLCTDHGGDGVLVLSGFGEKRDGAPLPPDIRRIRVVAASRDGAGLEARLASAARTLAAERYRNAYVSLAIYRPDFAAGSRGSEDNIEAVLGLVADFDDADAARWRERCPLEPQLVVETSEGRYQCSFFFDRPLEAAEAKPLAERLCEVTGCDSATKSLCQPWRLAGTLNWPNRKKVAEGRPKEPQVARVVKPWDGQGRTQAQLLRAKLAEAPTAPRSNGRGYDNHRDTAPNGHGGNGHDPEPRDLAALIARVPPHLLERVKAPPDRGDDRSAEFFSVALALLRHLDEAEAVELFEAYPNGPACHHLEKRNGHKRLVRDVARAAAKLAELAERDEVPGDAAQADEAEPEFAEAPVLDPRDPLPTARAFRDARYPRDTLHHHRGEFYSWNRSCYQEVSETGIRAGLYSFLEQAKRSTEKGPEPFRPNSAKVSDALDALRAVAHLSDHVAASLWLDGRADPPPHELLACANGLLHLPTGRLLPPTPQFFGLNAVDFDYDPKAPEPTVWTAFLDSLWPNDPEAIDCLQEIFGYCLTPDTREQKAFLLVGPKRSGKGTIARVTKALLGSANVAGPTLSGLGTNFGLAALIGKPLAIVSDARLSGRADQHVIAERILSVTGEDVLTVDRKYRDAWTGTLPTRFLILTNELPKIADASGALASRFIVLTLTQSFYGREDHDLTNKLLGDLPGIMNWAIAGWKRLRDRGRFQQPASSAEAIEELEDLGSPIGAFLREKCRIEPGATVPCETLFTEWRLWCAAQGRDHPGTVQTFGRDLRAAVPGLNTARRREDGRMSPRAYEGVGLL